MSIQGKLVKMKISFHIFLLYSISTIVIAEEAITLDKPIKSLNDAKEKYDKEIPDGKSVLQTIIASGNSNKTTTSSPTIIDYTTSTYFGSDGERTTKKSITEIENPGYTTKNYITIDGKGTATGVKVTKSNEVTITLNGNIETISHSGVYLNPSHTTSYYSGGSQGSYSEGNGSNQDNTADVEASISIEASESYHPTLFDPYDDLGTFPLTSNSEMTSFATTSPAFDYISSTFVTSGENQENCEFSISGSGCYSNTEMTPSKPLSGWYGGIYSLHQTFDTTVHTGITSSPSNIGSHKGSSSYHTTLSSIHVGNPSSLLYTGSLSSIHHTTSSIHHTTSSAHHTTASTHHALSSSLNSEAIPSHSSENDIFDEHGCTESLEISEATSSTFGGTGKDSIAPATASSVNSGSIYLQFGSGSHTGSSSIHHTTSSSVNNGATISQSASGSIHFGGSVDTSGNTSDNSSTSIASENNCHIFEENCIESTSHTGDLTTDHTTASGVNSGTTSSQSNTWGGSTSGSTSVSGFTSVSGSASASGSGSESGSGSGSGSESGSGSGSESGSGSGSESGTGSGLGSESGSGSGSDTGSGTGPGSGSGPVSGSGSGPGSETEPISGSESVSGSVSATGSVSGSISESGTGSGPESGSGTGHGSGSGSGLESGSELGSGLVLGSGSGSGSGSGLESGSGSGSESGSGSGSSSGSHTGSSSTGTDSSSNREIYEYVQLGPHMYFNGSVFTTTEIDSKNIYYRESSDEITLINPTKFCPYSQYEPFIQETISTVKSVGNALIYNNMMKRFMLVDQYGGEVLSYNTVTGTVVKLSLIGRYLHGIIPTSIPNEYIVIVDNAIVLLENAFIKDKLIMKYKKVLAIFDSVWSLTVGEIDSEGRLWIAAMYKNDNEENHIVNNLYMIENGKAILKDKNKQLVGGMAWSLNNNHLYSTDLLTGVIYDYQILKLSKEIIFNIKHHPYLKGIPYDVTVDKDDNIWTTLLGGTSVIKINFQTGNIIEIIATPTHYPISLAFGDVLDNKLFVSSAYAKHPTLDLAKTYQISNTNVTGSNNTAPVNTTQIFGDTTIEIKNLNNLSSSGLRYATLYTWPNYQISFTEKEKKKCGFLKDNITIQQVPVNVETKGMSLFYDIKDNAIFFTDMYKAAVIVYEPNTGNNVTLILEGVTSTSSIIPINNENNYYIVSEDHNLVLLKNKFHASNDVAIPFKEIIAKITPDDLNIVFGIGKVDSKGRLWIGTSHATNVYTQRSLCNLYLLHKKKLKVMEENITASGGMAWSTDNKHFYFADTGKGVIYKYNYTDSTAALTNRKILFNIKHHPNISGTISDITVDNEDFIWAALKRGSAVLRINAINGHIANVVAIPMKNPTTLTFAGPLRDMLYVSAEKENKNTINDDAPYTIVISNLGVNAGRKPTDRFVL